METFESQLQLLADKINDVGVIVNELYSQFPELNKECIRSRVRRYINTHRQSTTPLVDILTSPVTKSVEYKSDGSATFDRIICLQDSENVTPEILLKAHGMDVDKWEVITCKSNFYQSQRKGGTVINLYQSKITAKPKLIEVSIDDIKHEFEKLQGNLKPIQVNHTEKKDPLLYEINIADLHLGKFAYNEETGEALDTVITCKRFKELIIKECQNIQKLENVEKILFVWTNDFFNSDGISKSTTGGTPQDTDMKWQQLYLCGLNLLIQAIETLRQLAPVKTFYIASNHSRQVDYYAICTLSAWFRNYEDVEVLVDPAPRHYERFGNVLLGFAHSYYEKKQNLPHLMQIEEKENWGVTTYREYHLAHYHCEKVEEIGGIIFRWLPSITGADTWTNDSGYIGAVKRSYSFVYDSNGLVQMNCTII